MPAGISAADSHEYIVGIQAAMNADGLVTVEDAPRVGRVGR